MKFLQCIQNCMFLFSDIAVVEALEIISTKEESENITTLGNYL